MNTLKEKTGDLSIMNYYERLYKFYIEFSRANYLDGLRQSPDYQKRLESLYANDRNSQVNEAMKRDVNKVAHDLKESVRKYGELHETDRERDGF